MMLNNNQSISNFEMQEQLTYLWKEFCYVNKLENVSADDMLNEYNNTLSNDASDDLLNDKQLMFVTRFIDLWEVTIE